MRTCVTERGTIELTLNATTQAPVAGDEIIVKVRAAPINPSDLGLLIGPADPTTAVATAQGVELKIPEARQTLVAARLGQTLPCGNEGAGTVVAAGPDASHLMGRTVALMGGGLYAQYRRARAVEAIVMADGVTPEQAASATINPLTALLMVEAMRDEGHRAIVHTAAASNLGQMLVRICAANGVPLVNVVRSTEQSALLHRLGSSHIVDSTAPDFASDLDRALRATGATLLFDAIGGGELTGRILAAMERAQTAAEPFSRYGSTVHKQAYIYGRLDPSPIVLAGAIGMAWNVGGFLLTPRLAQIGVDRAAALRRRVTDEITTTFASGYGRTIGLREALRPDVIHDYARRSTGRKFLIDPSRDARPDEA